MQKEYLILMRGDKSCGAVKVEGCPEGLIAEVNIEQSVVLEKENVFKSYLIVPEKGENSYLGVLEDHKGSFVLKAPGAPFGVAVTVKNTVTGEEKLCCVCAEEGKIQEIQNSFFGTEKKETTEGVGVQLEKEYIKTAETKIMELFVDFEFEKVNGFFLRKNSKIAEYIMSGKEVYRRVNEKGYYLFGHKSTGEFVIAIPSAEDEETPFERCGEYSFKVRGDIPGKGAFYCIAAGSDESGEYFCRKR